MHPILTVVALGDVVVPIGSYGVLLCIAIGVGSALSLRAAHRAGLDLGACIAALGLVAAGAFAGAAVLHATAQRARTGSLAYALSHVGLAYFGAALGGTLVLCVAARPLGLNAARLADLSVPAIATAHAIGRVGCFLGGCCYGAAWHGPFAASYAPAFAGAAHAIPRHPVPLYEAAFLAMLAIAFTLARGRGVGSGRPLALYFALYAVFRLLVEELRGDAVRGVFLDGRVSTSQIAAALVLAVCLTRLAVGTQSACASSGSSRPPASSRSRSSSPRMPPSPTLHAGSR